MRRLLSVSLFMLLTIAALAILPEQSVWGQFATNTPENNSSGGNAVGASALPTSAPSGFSFATNTPDGPTPTPTLTATATLTPSATFTPSLTPSPTFTPSPTPVGPFSYPDNFNSLTGKPYPDDASRDRVNMVVKISNYPPVVRPQTGINLADVVYEYEAEGGVTRFAAIFRSQMPPLVGSVRSGRLMDMELMTMYRANLVYSGTSEPIQRLFIENYPYRLVSPIIGDSETNDCNTSVFCRIPREGLAREHTLFGVPEKMWEIAELRGTNQGYKARGFAFTDNPGAGGENVNDIFIDWYGQTDARWQYDAASGRYLRFTDGVPHFDRGDGQQLWADNIVVIVVPHERRPDLFPEGSNYESLEIQLWHHDDADFLYQAVVLRDGQLYQGFWDRPNRDDGTALHLLFGNNQPMTLKPGRTWVAVVRGLGDVTWSEIAVDTFATATLEALTPSPTPLNIQEGD